MVFVSFSFKIKYLSLHAKCAICFSVEKLKLNCYSSASMNGWLLFFILIKAILSDWVLIPLANYNPAISAHALSANYSVIKMFCFIWFIWVEKSAHFRSGVLKIWRFENSPKLMDSVRHCMFLWWKLLLTSNNLANLIEIYFSRDFIKVIKTHRVNISIIDDFLISEYLTIQSFKIVSFAESKLLQVVIGNIFFLILNSVNPDKSKHVAFSVF